MNRFRVNGQSPWPERVGCTGRLVAPLTPGIYPWDKPMGSNVVVWIDDDPLRDTSDNIFARSPEDWSCVMPWSALDMLASDD